MFYTFVSLFRFFGFGQRPPLKQQFADTLASHSFHVRVVDKYSCLRLHVLPTYKRNVHFSKEICAYSFICRHHRHVTILLRHSVACCRQSCCSRLTRCPSGSFVLNQVMHQYCRPLVSFLWISTKLPGNRKTKQSLFFLIRTSLMFPPHQQNLEQYEDNTVCWKTPSHLPCC